MRHDYGSCRGYCVEKSAVKGVVVDNARKRAQLMHEVQVQAQSYFDGPLHEGLLKAMATLSREAFGGTWDNQACSIGCGQTISQPLMVAVMTEVLLRYAPARGRVLEIGAGSGYQAALLGRFFDKVLAFERLRLLLERARNVLDAQGVENVELVHGNGGSIRDEGFQAVIVTCGVVDDIPSVWTKCLLDGGVLLLPHAQEEGRSMVLRCFKKKHGLVHEISVFKSPMYCRFVPFIDDDE